MRFITISALQALFECAAKRPAAPKNEELSGEMQWDKNPKKQPRFPWARGVWNGDEAHCKRVAP